MSCEHNLQIHVDFEVGPRIYNRYMIPALYEAPKHYLLSNDN